MPRDVALRVVDELAGLGFRRTIYFHVLGEPLLHPAVSDVVDHAARACMRPVLFTNGGPLTSQTVERVLLSKTAELVISMQTVTQSAYESLRGTALPWKTYLGRIQEALAAASRSTEEGDCVFRVSVGLKKPDPDHPEDIYFSEYESRQEIIDSVRTVFSKVEGADLDGLCLDLEHSDLAELKPVTVLQHVRLSFKAMGNWRRARGDKREASGQCRFFGKEVGVLSDGSTVFCHLDYDGETRFGNVNDISLAEMLGDPDFKALVADLVAGTRVPPACATCRNVKPVV